MSTWSVMALVGMLTAQSPDGPAPSVPSVPSAAPASPSQPYNPEAPQVATPPADPPPAAQPAPASTDTAPATADAGAPAADGKKDKKGFKGFKDIWGGVFVAGIGAGVVLLGGMMGGVAGVFMVFKQIPFPGGDGERNGFTTSAVVGAVFCAMVGVTLVTVGAALVGVSFL